MSSILRSLLLVILLAALAATVTLAKGAALAARAQWPSMEEHPFVPSPRVARLLSLGYNELVADLAWAKTLVYYGGGLGKNESLEDVEPLLRLVNRLDPHFRRPYQWGAHATMFRHREGNNRRTSSEADAQASIEILERGLAAFPTDWELAWLIGLRYYLDLKGSDASEKQRNKEIGASYIEKAMRMPGSPSNLPLLAASLRTKLGQHDHAVRELRDMILTTEDSEARNALERRYAQLTSRDASGLIAQVAEMFQREWKAALPYAPQDLFVILAPRKKRSMSLASLAQGDVFEADETADSHIEAIAP